MKIPIYSVFLIAALGCGDKKDHVQKKTGDKPRRQSSEKQTAQEEARYFSLVDTCDISGGFAVVDGKCTRLGVALSIDGKVSVASESGKKIFEGGIRFKPAHEFPFVQVKRKNTEGFYEYNLKKRENVINLSSLSVVSSSKTDGEVAYWVNIDAFAGIYSRARVNLEIFDQKFTPEDQDFANLEKTCAKIHSEFMSRHPIVTDKTLFMSYAILSEYVCSVGNQRELFYGELEDFKSFDLNWRCEKDICYFESLSLN